LDLTSNFSLLVISSMRVMGIPPWLFHSLILNAFMYEVYKNQHEEATRNVPRK
jgi:hypothetical protein